MNKICLVVMLSVLLASCVSKPPVVTPPPPDKVEPLIAVDWEKVEGWESDKPIAALETFKRSCKAIGKREQWRNVCAEAIAIKDGSNAVARTFFEDKFQPWQVQNVNGSTTGLITGYYGPELDGSPVRTKKFRHPLYKQPEDLLIIDLDEIYPALGDYRLRGRVVGNRVVPYFERSEINSDDNPLAGNELFWVEDPVELFFLHIQGSGRIRLPSGERVMVGYDNQNGYPYKSIGKLLLQRNAMTRDQMSMQNIASWVRQHPKAGEELLAENPSYIFFRALKSDIQSPLGALGVQLTPLRSLAVDPRTIPLGAPVFLATTYPGVDLPLQQLMVAQDVGGAIKGQVRADFFWGMGTEAGKIAGRMKQDCRLWVLLPKDNNTDSH